MARVKYTKEEIKQKRKEQRQKAALKSYRCRGLKNFLFYLTGFLTSIVFLVSALFVGLKVVPIKTYLGDSSNEMLSEEVSSKSIIDALLNASKYDMNDFPIVVDAVDELLDSIGVDGFIVIDKEKVKSLDFNDDFTSGLLSCIKIAEGGAEKLLGEDLGQLEIFQNTWEIIPTESDDQPQTGTDGNILKTDKGELLSNPKLYYFQRPVDGGTSPLAKTYSESYEWVRAFDDDGKPINGYTGTQTLYYANLNAVPIVDVLDLIDESLGRVSITSILDVVGLGGNSGGSSGEGTEGGSGDSGDTAGDLINKIFDGVNIQDVGNIKMEELFSNLLISDLGLGEDVANIIGSIVVDENNNPIPFESVSIGHLMSGKFNVNGLKLGELLKDNDEILDLLSSVVVDNDGNPVPSSDITIGHLLGANENAKLNVNGLKLGELLKDNDEILDLLSSVVVDNDGNPVPSSEITIGHLLGVDENAKLNVNNLKLGELLKDNDEILDLLSSVVVDKEGNSVAKEDITIGHLLGLDENAKLDVNNLKLGELLKDNDEILDLLSSIVVDAEGNPVPSSDITIGHLLGVDENAKLNVNNLKLGELLKGNDDILDLLSSIVVDTDGNSVPSSDITIGHLMGTDENVKLDVNNLKLADLLKDNDEILDLLSSVVVDKEGNSVAKEDITIGHLMGADESAKLNINNLKLAEYLDSDTLELLASIILDENDNPIPAGDITIGHLTADNMNFNGIKLNNFLDEGILETLSSIILDEYGNSILPNDLTIAHLSGSNFELNNLKLDKFLDADTLELLSSMIVDEYGNAILAANLTIAHIKSVNMNFDGIKLDKFLGDYSDNKEMYDMLHSIIKWEAGTTPPTADKLTVGNLSNGINFNNLSLSKFLGDYESHKDVYETLSSIIIWPAGVTPPTADKLTVGDLSYGIDFDKFDYSGISLERILGKYEDNKDMYNILYSIIDWPAGMTPPTADKLTVGDLSNGINFNKLLLEQVLGDYDENKITYDVLCSAVGLGSGEQNYSKLTIEHLKEGIDFDKVSLQVLGLDDGTLNMLLNAANASRKQGDPEIAKGDLTIKHISSDIFSYIRLTDVMPFNAGANGNAQLYSILLQASSVTLIDPTDNNEIGQKAQTLNISSLSNFKIELVNLSTILPISENAKLYDILADVTGEEKGKIKISDFASFDPTKIHLSTVMESSENVILKKLIESGATIGNLGDAINELSLYDIYGENCFKERKGADAGNQPTYNKVVSGKYVRYDLDKTGNGKYVISEEAGVWLILCFKPTEGSGVVIDTKSKYYGCRESYTATTANMESLQNGTNIAGTIGGATIRELVIIGLIEDSATLKAAYAGTLQEALALIKFGK